MDNGYEIQIDATDAADRTTGSVYGFKSADLAARDAALNPPGEWNTYEILVEGERLQVFLNGVKINDFTNTDPARSLAGHIGIQNHGTGDDVSFRNIRIKELGGPATGRRSGRVVSARQRGRRRSPRPAPTTARPSATSIPGDWAALQRDLDLAGATSFKARVVSGGPGGTIQVRTGSPTGPVLGSVAVPNTGSWTTFADVSTPLSGVPSGTANVYLTFTGTGTGLFDVDDFTWSRSTAAAGTGPIKGLAGKCLDVAAARPPTAPRSSSTPATAEPRRPGPATAELADEGARQVPGRLRRRHGRRHEDPALDLQRLRRAELVGAVRRHAAQPAVGQVPRRVRQQLGRQHRRCTCGPAHHANQKWTLP